MILKGFTFHQLFDSNKIDTIANKLKGLNNKRSFFPVEEMWNFYNRYRIHVRKWFHTIINKNSYVY